MNDHSDIEAYHPIGGELSAASNARVLAVGDTTAWREACGGIPKYRDLSFCDIDEIESAMLLVIRPSLIVSPVVTPSFDCLELASRLEGLRFGGAFRAIARNLPRPEMICREVRGLCPTLDFDIIAIGAGAGRPI